MEIGNHMFFKKKLRISKRGILKYFGVQQNSYAGSIVERLYDYYCNNAVNLYVEYFLHYKREFRNFTEFLEMRFNLFSDEAEQMNSVLLYYKNLSYQLNSNFPDMHDHEGKDTALGMTFKSFLEDDSDAD